MAGWICEIGILRQIVSWIDEIRLIVTGYFVARSTLGARRHYAKIYISRYISRLHCFVGDLGKYVRLALRPGLVLN